MRSIEISLRGCIQETAPVLVGVVLPYSKKEATEVARRTDSESVIAVFFSTLLDVETLGKRMQVHHLYYNAFACSSIPLDARIGSGSVYKATVDEGLKLLGSQGNAGETLYKIYLPNSLKQIAKGAEVIYGLNVVEELEKVRSTGLCVVIGGANMLGIGFLSNSLRVPVSVVGDTLVVNDEDLGVWPAAASSTGNYQSVKETQEILQLVLELPRLQQFYHPEVPGRKPVVLLQNQHVPPGVELWKFNERVKIVAPADLGDAKQAAFLQITSLSIGRDRAEVTLEYPIEGVIGTVKLSKDGDAWRVRDGHIVED